MALTRITKGVIKPNENYDTHNIVSTGIVTSVGLDVNGNADISGSLSVGGVLTYEDVTSIDSVGIITARTGLVSPNADIDDFVSVGNNIHLGNAGVITATSFVGSGAALTGIDATAIKDSGGNVKVQAQASGAMYTGIHTFSSGAEVGSNIKLGNAGVITATSFVGSGAALTGIDATAVKDTGGNVKIQAQASGAVYTGIHTFVTLKSTSGTFTGDIDVDGHTNLDNLSVAGVSTFAGTLNASTVSSTAFIASGDLDVDGHTNLDNVSITGVSTFSGILDATNTPASIRVAQDIQHKGDADTKITFPAADTVSVETGGSERLRITSTGKMGLGKSSPSQLLHLKETGSNSTYIALEATDANNNVGILMGDPDDIDTGFMLYNNQNNYLAFATNGANERLRIDSAGNLSLGKGSASSTNYGRNFQIHHDGTSGASLHLTDNNTGSGNGDGFHIISTSQIAYLWQRENANMVFGTNGSARWNIYGSNGHLAPNADSTFDIGTSSVRVRNGYFDTLYGDGSNLTNLSVSGSNIATALSTQRPSMKGADFTDDGTGNPVVEIKADDANPWGLIIGNTAYSTNQRGIKMLQEDGGHTKVRISGQGEYRLLNFEQDDGSSSRTLMTLSEDGGVYLRHQGNIKLNTTSTGVSITGNLSLPGVCDATNVSSTPDKIGNYKICRVNGAISSIDNLDSFLLSKTDGSYTGGTKPSDSHNGLGIISMQTHIGNYFSQLALSTNTNDLFTRSSNGGSSFGSWQRLAKTSTGNIIGYSPNFPAGSAENIKDAVSGTPDNGWYWIQQFGNVARLHYCAFKDKNGSDIAGGPWTMNWIAGVHPNQFSTNGSTALSQYMNLCKGIGIDKAGRGMESSRTTSQVYGAWLAVKRALWDLDPGLFNGASSAGGGVMIMPIMNINGEGGSSDHRLVYSTGTSTHIPPNQDGDHCNQNQLFCGWWGGNDFSSWATDNNSVPSPEDWGPGDAPHTGDIGAKSNSTPQKPSWKDLMLVTCIYK